MCITKKLCKKCGVEKELQYMVKHSQTKDGYLFKCKECDKIGRRLNKGTILEITKSPKLCPVCNIEKITDDFNVSARSKDGLQFLCRECYNHHMQINQGKDRNYFLKLRKKVDKEFKEKLREQKRENSRKNHISTMLANARRRAANKGLEFDLTKEDIIIPKLCPILNVPFIVGTKENYDFTPTIDRIDNLKGYTKDNIQIITHKANSMKNSADFEMLKEFADYVNNNIK